jgi:hypothetical protein
VMLCVGIVMLCVGIVMLCVRRLPEGGTPEPKHVGVGT